MILSPSPSGLRIRVLEPGDLPFADALRAAVGWNQTLPDWHRFLAHEPGGCFLAELDGQPVGTATTTRHGVSGELAWIGMVLVDPAFRRQGIGRALLQHAIHGLDQRGVRWVRLDATPDGKPVYDGLGFREDWTLTRWERGPSTQGPTSRRDPKSGAIQLAGLTPPDLPGLLELDAAAFGSDRSRLLRALLADARSALRVGDPSHPAPAYGLLRDGARAAYLGPVVAREPEAGRSLVACLLHSTGGERVFWDIPDSNIAARGLASELGFTEQRRLHRMTLRLGVDRAPCPDDVPPWQWALAGPEVG